MAFMVLARRTKADAVCKDSLEAIKIARVAQRELTGNRQFMRIQGYLRVYSDESAVRAIHDATKVPGATITQHLKVKAQWSVTGKDAPWSWTTARVPINIDKLDEGLSNLLAAHKSIFPIIRKYQGSKTAITLQLITQYDKDDDTRGLHLSAETISLLNELGAAFDNDVVSRMTDDHPE
jgi:hypothetical protein